ncbi:negative cofactor 2 transcription regulator complex subunit ncb2 [Polyrhizophydium stewartii]|uniref:Negative cofactor 2 transcription regulator complex subunit ncb2 n=1 Tax=Polyrhizophydium stewartii TaxID=2732419 RepID=A0ABR4N2H3_9FUNG|nr:negative cofactor 2 transcription regulator complex subunit ncb2 [Polyrhizophydium stewartii]
MDDDAVPRSLGDEELTLPKATLAKLIQEILPADVSCAKETKDLLGDCCVEFIHLLSSEANEISERESRKTIAGEHVIAALKVRALDLPQPLLALLRVRQRFEAYMLLVTLKSLGFEEYISEIEGVQTEHQKSLKDREKRSTRLEDLGMSTEELLKNQEALFAKARERMLTGASSSMQDAPDQQE